MTEFCHKNATGVLLSVFIVVGIYVLCFGPKRLPYFLDQEKAPYVIQYVVTQEERHCTVPCGISMLCTSVCQ
mgnify:CR=1 FL=1